MRHMKQLTVYKDQLQTFAEKIATEINAPVEKVAKCLTELFEKEDADELNVCYYVEIDPFPDGLELEKVLENIKYESVVLPEEPYEQPQYVSKLRPYRKHESHRKPNYWPRIRSNPRQR